MATTKTKPTMKSDENKCATNYSIITNNKWNVNTHHSFTDIEPGAEFDQVYPVAKKQTLFFDTENYFIEFLRFLIFRNKFQHSEHWIDDMWKSKMAGRWKPTIEHLFFVMTDHFVLSSSPRSFRTPSQGSYTAGQALIPNNLFEYLFHNGWTVNSHSIMNSGLTPG